MNGPRLLPARARLLGLAPLAFFLAHHAYHWSRGRPADSLWLCHVSNLTLALGLFLASPGLIRLAVAWLLPGVPLWIADMIQTGDAAPTTFLSHLGGTAVGLLALRRVGAAEGTWIAALAWFLLWQQLCRLVTPAELNVNIAHRMRPGWERVFDAYWQYWLASTALAALMLWLVGKFLARLFPPRCQYETA